MDKTQLMDFLEYEILVSMEEKLINYLIKYPNRYFTKQYLYNALDVKGKKERSIYQDVFKILSNKKIIYITNKKKVSINKNIRKGRIYYSRTGKPFINYEGSGKSIVINKSNTSNSIHGDSVLIDIERKRVLKVLGRVPQVIEGVFMVDEKGPYLIPEDEKIHKRINLISSEGAQAYDSVSARVYKFNYKNRVYASITENYGLEFEDENLDINDFLKSHKVKSKFNIKAIAEAKKVSKITERDKLNRLDLRDDLIFTIDGDDAKDLDDAISINKINDNTYRLGVHIADVSHYVRRGSELDKEAYLRGTSIYLVDRAIPMLPEQLSNGVCSLFPNKERLTISIIMDIDKNGNLLKSSIYKSIIKSKAQLTYNFVQDVIMNPKKEFDISDDLKESLLLSFELAKKLEAKRINRGSIDFDIKSPRVILDENGRPTDVVVNKRKESNNIIQEFMLLSNETIAAMFKNKNKPFLFRVHPSPQEDALENFIKVLNIHGHKVEDVDVENITPEDISKIVNTLNENDHTDVLKKHLLKSMRQAKYSDINDIHFGLASNGYCHFTSPIRRYPDLEIHRIIKAELLSDDIEINSYNDLSKKITEIAKSCSLKERKAEQVEQDHLHLNIIDYLNKNAEKEFNSSIVEIKDKYLILELENAIEGYVYINDLEFDEEKFKGYSQCSNKVFSLGDKIKVKPNILESSSELEFSIIS